MHRLRILLLVIALGSAGLAPAEVPPAAVVHETADLVIERLNKGDVLTDDQAYALVEDLILPHLDFETFARLTLGKHWRQASRDQQQAFTRNFRDLLIRTYATSLNAYAGEHVVYLDQHDEGDDRVLVQTEITRPHGEPIRADYRLHQRDNQWKVYDVVIEGVSLILTYRSSFSEQISRTGLDDLIARLENGNITMK